MALIDILVLGGVFLILLAIGVPVAFCIGLATVATMLVSIDLLPALTTVAQRMATGLDSFTLLAIPFFILAGQIMNRGGIARRLIDFAKAIVGTLPGGLAIVNVMASVLFGAISGSAVAAASAIGGIMTPRMREDGYSRAYSAAVNVASAPSGMLIPPSNTFIVYSLVSSTSIAALFMAGAIPGIMWALACMVVVYIYARKQPGRLRSTDRITASQALLVLWRAVPSLLMIIIVVGGILAGFFTATESASMPRRSPSRSVRSAHHSTETGTMSTVRWLCAVRSWTHSAFSRSR